MSEAEAYAEDAAIEVNASDMLTKISDKVDELARAQKEVEDAEAVLKAKQAVVVDLEQRVIPDMMKSVRQTVLTTTSGLIVEMEEKLRASIPKGREAPAFTWLRENGHGSVIKNEVKVLLGRGEDNVQGAIMDDLKQRGLEPESKTTVHPQTLISLLNELLLAGKNVPLELFGGFQQTFVKITRPKVKNIRIK